MNSMSRGYNESCGKEKRREEEKHCPTIIKCGCPSSATITGTDTTPGTGPVASVTVNNECLCDPITKLEFATIITSTAEATVSLQVLKQCRHQFTPVPVGPTWTVTAAAETPLPLSFFICDGDSCDNDCCTYIVQATFPEAATVTFSNATVGAISTCKSNRCNKCKKDYDR